MVSMRCDGTMPDDRTKSGSSGKAGSTCPDRKEGNSGQSGDRFIRFIGQSRDGILITNEAGSLTEWNPALERITGLMRSEVLGKPVWEVYCPLIPPEKRTPDYPEFVRSLVLCLLQTGQSVESGPVIELEIRCPDNQTRIIESCMFAIPEGNTFIVGAVLRDITGRKRSEHALLESKRKLLLMSSITRHDINNQLTIFNGYLSLLDSGTPGLTNDDIVRILLRATDKIERILKFTREYQDIGAKPPAWQDLDETILLAKKTFEGNTVRFSTGHVCKGIEIYADPLLGRVFSNLIDNSLRHGERVSEIRMHFTIKGQRLVLVYEDDGIGIPDSLRPILFERSMGKKSGYGMFLVREILAVTGCTIAETGESGKGARFEIVVPEGSFRLADS